MDQKDIVDEREKNIKDIADMVSKVNQISKEMNQLIHKQDENLDSIHKKQDKVQKNAQQTVQDLVDTDNLTKKKLKRIAIWAVAIILLGLCVVGLVYIIKGNKKKENKDVAFVVEAPELISMERKQIKEENDKKMRNLLLFLNSQKIKGRPFASRIVLSSII